MAQIYEGSQNKRTHRVLTSRTENSRFSLPSALHAARACRNPNNKQIWLRKSSSRSCASFNLFFLFALTIRQGALESKRNHKRASCGCSESRAELRKAFLKMRKRKEWVRHGRQPKWPVMAASMESCSRSPFCHGYFLHSGWLFFQQDIGVNDSQRVDLTDPPPYVMASGQKKTRPIPTDAWHTCVEEDTRWPEGASRKDTRLTYHPVEKKKNLRKEKRSSSSASGHLGTRKKKKSIQLRPSVYILYINHVSCVSPAMMDTRIPTWCGVYYWPDRTLLQSHPFVIDRQPVQVMNTQERQKTQ